MSNFDTVYEQLLLEIDMPRKSRYWNMDKPHISGQVRAIRNNTHKTDSQNTKLGAQQYVGNNLNHIRFRNKSKKSPDEIGIANGIGGIASINGVNPKSPRSSVNSKQGNMEIKYSLGNGKYRIGPKIKTNYIN